MTLAAIALILAAGLAGPVLASWKRGNMPVAVGELLIGVLLGPTGINAIPVHDPTLKLLESIGFALVMLVVGSHLNVQSLAVRTVARQAVRIVLVTLAAAVAVAFVIDQITGYRHVALFALLLTSSSAAIVLPILDRIDNRIDARLLIAVVTISDIGCIIALPFVMHSTDPVQTTSVAIIVALLATLVYFLLRTANRRGNLDRFRGFSKANRFGLELRISLLVVIGLAAFTTQFHVTVMIAGFSIGLAIAGVGVPRRLARQLFAVTEGFFAPIFFVMLGTSIDVRGLLADAHGIALAIALAAGTALVHLTGRAFGIPVRHALMAGAQLGVPVAAVTIGQASGELSGVESSAILAAALVSILITTLAARSLEIEREN